MSAAALVNKPVEGAGARFQKPDEAGIFSTMADWPGLSPHVYTH
jgi:hypothetical protein